MLINTFRYTPEDVACPLCTEYTAEVGCVSAPCPWFAERVEAGCIQHQEAIYYAINFNRELYDRFRKISWKYPHSLWKSPQHFRRMENRKIVQGYSRRRDTPKCHAAMYLLTANEGLDIRTAPCFSQQGIQFSRARLRGISLHSYTLYTAAQCIYADARKIFYNDLKDPEIIDDEAFWLILNAILIAKYGVLTFPFFNNKGPR